MNSIFLKNVSYRPVVMLAVLLVVGSLGGCRKPKEKNDKADQAGQQAVKTDKTDKTDKPVAADGPCQQYAGKVCTILGERTQACGSFKAATELMPPAACTAGLGDLTYTQNRYKEKSKVCDELLEKLCTEIGNETDTCKMIREQTKSFDPSQCESMMKQYPRVLSQVKKMAEAEKPLSADLQKSIADAKIGAHGPKDAKVTVVEFSDFECPHCSGVGEVVNKIKSKYEGKVRIVFRHFPLPFHKDAHLASQAALAAGAQGKFFEYHDLLFKNQRQLKREQLEKYAQELKLDMKKFKADLDSKIYAKTVDADIELGKNVGVRGTPAMYLNGKAVPNPKDFDLISKKIDELLVG